MSLPEGTVYEPPGGFPEPEPNVQATDLGNARLFAWEHQDRFRHVVAKREWLVWRDGRWRPDRDGAVMRAAKETVDGLFARAIHLDGDDDRKAAVRHALASQAEPALRRMLALAGTEEALALTPESLDSDPWLLACTNGTLDLRTGALREHEDRDLISLGTDIVYDPDAGCPRWARFLVEVFDGDLELVEFVRRAVGYSLTGDTREHALFICYGSSGRNGKTTFLEMLNRIAGDHYTTATFDTFLRQRHGRAASNDLARLHRARIVAASESGEGRRLDEALVKELTGGDTIAARFLYAEYFEFRPMFKLWLRTNHRPRVDGTDEAMWARIRLIPFDVSFLGREDLTLDTTLHEELPGILAWAVKGCLAWQQDGLGTAAAVANATNAYRADEDALGAFLTERCDLEQATSVTTADLRHAYEQYCGELGEQPLTPAALGRHLAQRGIRRTETKPRRYLGVRITPDSAPAETAWLSQNPGSPNGSENFPPTHAREEVPGTTGPTGVSGANEPDDDKPLF